MRNISFLIKQKQSMKVLSKLIIAVLAISVIVSCKKTPEGEKAKVGEASKEVATAAASAQNFNVTNGTLYWTGTKVGGQHSGTINLGKGQLSVEGGNITSGDFSIDMSTMKNTDLPAEKQGDLIGHLASADFFDTGKYPTGEFKIVSVNPVTGNEELTHNITGNLTLKGITKSITIPANVIVAGNTLTAVTPKFTINRVDWDIKYGAKILGVPADKIIHDDISLNLELTASK